LFDRLNWLLLFYLFLKLGESFLCELNLEKLFRFNLNLETTLLLESYDIKGGDDLFEGFLFGDFLACHL